jgi:amino acid transporter
MSQSAAHIRTLGRKDIVLFTVSAILLLDTLAAGASVGASAVFWWLFLGVVFFVPYALICAEMGTTYPEQGGLYAWVRDAFGRRWASRATWAYWVNTAVWIPANVILFAGIFKQMFMPEMSLPTQIGIGVALVWIAVTLNVVTLSVGKWVPNIGALIKMVVILSIMTGAVVFVRENGMANALTLETMMPTWGTSLEYFSVIIYGMLGFELASAGSEEMKNPARDVPAAILLSGSIIIALYTSATIAILAAIPSADIDLVEGLLDTLHLFFGSTEPGRSFAVALGIGALYTFFSNSVTWALGCNRAMAEAAGEREFPAVFAVEHKRLGTPVGAAIMMGLVATVALLFYGYTAESNADLFWSLFAFSAAIFLVPYVMLVFAFSRMRRIDPGRRRPYRVPGGDAFGRLLAWVCGSLLVAALVLFIYTPGRGIDGPVFYGFVAVMIIGEVVIRITEQARHADPKAHGEA